MNAIPQELLKEAPRVWRDNGNGVNVRVVDPKWMQAVADRMRAAQEKREKAEKREAEAEALKAELVAQIAVSKAHKSETEAESLRKTLDQYRSAIKAVDRTGNATAIIKLISAAHAIPVKEIKGQSRVKIVANARHHAMYEVYRLCQHLSLPRIGEIFGGRDHTTVLHAVRRWPEKAASLGIDCEPIKETSA